VRFWFQMVYSEPGLDALIDLTVRTRMVLPPDTLLSFFDPDPDQDIRALLPTISVPTLITRGTADRVSSPEDAIDFARSVPNVRMYLFAGRCHVPIFTATTKFCEVLRQFTRTGSVPEAASD
jgi:pimeloyl-ACP methyl ester carboxylesterase